MQVLKSDLRICIKNNNFISLQNDLYKVFNQSVHQPKIKCFFSLYTNPSIVLVICVLPE